METVIFALLKDSKKPTETVLKASQAKSQRTNQLIIIYQPASDKVHSYVFTGLLYHNVYCSSVMTVCCTGRSLYLITAPPSPGAGVILRRLR